MILIDGSFGEGGGQILRTAVALSAVTGEPVEIGKIRANRENPGLQAQHLTAVRSVSKICDAVVEGDFVGSMELSFTPRRIRGGVFDFDVGTAGSITLVLQALMIPAVFSRKDFYFKITGGTDVRWSPPIDYLRNVTLPLLERFGIEFELGVLRRGYYPKGGGIVELKIKAAGGKSDSLDLASSGQIQVKGIYGISHAHNDLKKNKVVERQASAARKIIFEKTQHKGNVEIMDEYVDSLSIGTGITMWADLGDTILGANALGERGRKAEEVGAEAAVRLAQELESKAPLDRFMGDQILPYLAFYGGRVRVSEITGHAKTNIWVLSKFGFRLRILEEERIIESCV